MDAFSFVGVGMSTWDLLFQLSGDPSFDGSTEVLAGAQQGGGPAATAAVTASRLGGDATLVSAVGDDVYASLIRADLEHFAVTDELAVDPDAPSTVVAVLVEAETGERMFLRSGDSPRLRPASVPSAPIETADCLLVDAHAPAATERAIELAEDAVVVADVESVDERIRGLVTAVDVLIVPEAVVPDLVAIGSGPDQQVSALRDLGPTIAVITQGTAGSVVAHSGGTFHQPAFDVDVVDTTGAGDVFHGAFAAGRCQDWSIERVTAFATAVAARNCTALGGRGAIPTASEAFAFLAARSADWTRSGPV